MADNLSSSDTIDEQRLAKVDPDNATLLIMIVTLLRDYEDANTARWLYEHVKYLMEIQDPLISQLARANDGSYAVNLYNSIIKALGRHASNIPLCLQILGEMSAPKKKRPDETGIAEPSSKGDGSLVPKPTAVTWGILTNMFMDHRQPRAAEKVIDMMRERGIQPARSNWQILLKGYARLQDTQAVVHTLDRSERDGFPPDRGYWKALRDIQDKRALNEGIRTSQLMRMKEEVDRLDELAQQRKMEPKQPEPVEEIPTQIWVEDMEIRPATSDEDLPVKWRLVASSPGRRRINNVKQWKDTIDGSWGEGRS